MKTSALGLFCLLPFLAGSCGSFSVADAISTTAAILTSVYKPNVKVKEEEDPESGGTGPGIKNPPDSEFIRKAEFTEGTATITWDNLKENTVYLVKINKSDAPVAAANTGGVKNLAQNLLGFNASRQAVNTGDDPNAREGSAIRDFNANPPPVVYSQDQLALVSKATAFVPPAVGAGRKFWLEANAGASWVQKQATLRAVGKYSNVWVTDDSYSPSDAGTKDKKITSAQAKALADKFDLLYPVETALLGFEFGGGPGGDGGRDGDPKIQIVVTDTSPSGGYFWSKDYYTQGDLERFGWDVKTNLGEIFYVSITSVDSLPDYAYSTLAHEFQHMINFNMKFIKHRKNSSAWYNETLSTMAEDVIAPLIGISPTNEGHPIQQRIDKFLETYNKVGITEWQDLENISYAKGYAFGAYLMRNYGGPELLSKILANNTTDADSITGALNEIQPGLTFGEVLERYGEALIFSGTHIPAGGLTFDKTISQTIKGTKYTVYGFDVWDRPESNNRGPKIFGLTQQDMRPHSIAVHSSDAWKNKSGSFSVTLEKPANPNIVLYLLVR
jgi:hypothetical protein